MKRFWLVLLSLGLVMAFSVSAFAVDVKVSGEYYAAGLYLDKTDVKNFSGTIDAYIWHPSGHWDRAYNDDTKADQAGSTAFYYQRLRIGTDFIVSPCLKLVTRFDAMERIWGGARSDASSTALDTGSAGTRSENQNIAFDYVYVDYVSPIGTFDIGYGPYAATGTIFANSLTSAGSIKYKYDFKGIPASLMLGISKVTDTSASAVSTSTDWTDGDKDMYGIEGVYNFKDGKAGMKVSYYRYADTKPASDYDKEYFQFTPYVIAKIGPVNVQAEINYGTGKAKKYDDSKYGDNVDLDQWNGWIDATANFGMFYAGGTFAYVSGDDPDTTDTDEGATNSGGLDYKPCLLLFNSDITYWAGNVTGYDSSNVSGAMANALFFQARVGVKPTSQTDVMFSVSYATADKKPAGFQDGDYGWELDLTGTYKITNNLSYTLGAGYLFTGDFFKGKGSIASVDAGPGLPPGVVTTALPSSGNTDVQNDFIIMNKLTLTF